MKRALGRLHNFDPLDKEASPVWDTVEGAKAFEKLMDAMKYFLGAIGITTLLLGGHRGDERDAGGGARAHA